MSDTIRIKVHRVAGHKPGSVVLVSVDDRFWQRRLKDAERDQSCEVVTPKPSAIDAPAFDEYDEAQAVEEKSA